MTEVALMNSTGAAIAVLAGEHDHVGPLTTAVREMVLAVERGQEHGGIELAAEFETPRRMVLLVENGRVVVVVRGDEGLEARLRLLTPRAMTLGVALIAASAVIDETG